MATLPFHGIFSVLRIRNYRIYLCGNVISLIGLWTQRIAVGWLAWELTHSGAWLGAVAFADLCPSLIIGPFAGVLADRMDRIKIVLCAQSLSMLQAVLLAILASNDAITITSLLLLVLFNGVVTSINQPARLAIVSSLVPRAHLSTAVAMNAISFNLARFIGPAVAGFLILFVGVQGAFALNSITFVAMLIALVRIRLPESARAPSAGARAGVLQEIAEGFSYIRTHASIGPLLLLAAAVGLGLRCFVELLPGFVGQVFGHGADGLAALASAIGVGAVAGGLWVAQQGSTSSYARVALLNSLFTALSILAFAATDVFWFALGCAAVCGFFMSISGISVQTTVQMAADPHVRGRILSIYGLIMRATPATGALILGVASEWLGMRLPLVLSAIACLLVWLLVWRRRDRIDQALQE